MAGGRGRGQDYCRGVGASSMPLVQTVRDVRSRRPAKAPESLTQTPQAVEDEQFDRDHHGYENDRCNPGKRPREPRRVSPDQGELRPREEQRRDGEQHGHNDRNGGQHGHSGCNGEQHVTEDGDAGDSRVVSWTLPATTASPLPLELFRSLPVDLTSRRDRAPVMRGHWSREGWRRRCRRVRRRGARMLLCEA